MHINYEPRKYCISTSRRFDGRRMTIPMAIKLHGGAGVTPALVHKRMYHRGWSFEDAVKTPRMKRGGQAKQALTPT